jgi:prevent-host-death family protein
MRTVTATELRMKLGEILDAASAGERILVERDHKPLVYVLSVEAGQALEAQDDAIARELAALDALSAIGDAWRQAHPRAEGEMTAAEEIRWDRDHRDDPQEDDR